MATRFDINVFSKELMQDIEAKAIVWVNKALDYIEVEIDKRTPIDSWEYQRWNKIKKAEKIGNQIYWEAYNDSVYAENVEYWFSTKKLNWWKNKKKWWPMILANSQGARTYTITADNESENIKNIIKKEIW